MKVREVELAILNICSESSFCIYISNCESKGFKMVAAYPSGHDDGAPGSKRGVYPVPLSEPPDALRVTWTKKLNFEDKTTILSKEIGKGN